MLRIKSDKIILSEGIFNGYIYFDDNKILDVTAEEREVSKEFDFTGLYVSAGFIDIHTHGGGGNHFEGSVREIVDGCNFHLSHGTTSICPTISADSIEIMSGALCRVEEAMSDQNLKANIIGVHMEGPYLSTKQAGAQCADFITPPKHEDYVPLIKEHKNAIARWTYAPENDENERFVKFLNENGIVASAGHTDATYTDMLRAFNNGCKLITHLYSCTSTITRDQGFRILGVTETAYLLDDMFVEIICDGKHLPPELIKLVYKQKGDERIALVTDSLALAGTNVSHGFMQNTEFIIEEGVCRLMDRSAFAGSIATTDRLVRVAVKEADIPLVSAVKMMTKIPATIMNIADKKGTIEKGKDADFVVFDEDINVKSVFVNGNKIKL